MDGLQVLLASALAKDAFKAFSAFPEEQVIRTVWSRMSDLLQVARSHARDTGTKPTTSPRSAWLAALGACPIKPNSYENVVELKREEMPDTILVLSKQYGNGKCCLACKLDAIIFVHIFMHFQ